MAGQADGDRTGPAVRCVACGQVPATVTAVWPAWRAARYLSHMHADVRTPAASHLAQIGAAPPHLGPGACRALLELTTGVKGWAVPPCCCSGGRRRSSVGCRWATRAARWAMVARGGGGVMTTATTSSTDTGSYPAPAGSLARMIYDRGGVTPR